MTFCLKDLSLRVRCFCVGGGVYLCYYVQWCLLYEVVFTNVQYMYIIIDASSCWCPVINIKWPLSLLTNFGLTPTLSDMSIGTPAYYQASIFLEYLFPFFHSKSMFVFTVVVFLVGNKWSSIVFNPICIFFLENWDH
jgi:hypothetical protein